MVTFVLKATSIWLLMVGVAVGNALFRDKLLAPAIGPATALPVSGFLLTMLVFLAALASVPLFDASTGKSYVLIGLIWLTLTLSFEFLFGHFVAGKPWHEIVRVFRMDKGDLFVLVLLSTLISPWLSAKMRGLI